MRETEPTHEDALHSITCLNEVLLTSAKKSRMSRKSDDKPEKIKKKAQSKTWFNTECVKYRKVLRKYSRNLSSQPFNRHALHNFQFYRMKYKTVCRKAEKQYRQQLTAQLKDMEGNDPKQFWDIINRMNNWGIEKTDRTDSITPFKWHNFYKDLLNNSSSSNNLDKQSVEENKNVDPIFEPVLDGRIKISELREALSELKTRKSPGPDAILAEYLKIFGEMYEDILLKIVRIMFSRHIYPTEWDTNYLKPIHKKDDTDDPDNYRGIALGSTFAKLYSLILLKRLTGFIETYKLISPNQIGFMKGSRTSDHIFLLQTLIEKVVKKHRGKMYVAFIDFKKAYDTVDRQILFKRLNNLGISGIFYKNIVAMYEKTKYAIKVQNGYIDPINSNLGLRQGCPLSPMLFNLYIEDVKYIFGQLDDAIPLYQDSINHFLYADDLVLVSKSAKGLQNCLNKLADYADSKHLTINVTKSKTMVFNSSGKFIKEQFHIHNKTLEPVRSFSYLGFEVKPSGTVKHATNTLYDKANKALRPLLCAIARFKLPTKTSIKLFHILISPIALYNVENWATMTEKELESFERTSIFDKVSNAKIDIIHRKFLKYTLGLSKSCPNMAIYGDCGETPISMKGYKLMLDYWKRLNILPESTLAKKALRENINLRTNWIRTIEKLLVTFKLIEVENYQKFKLESKVNSKTYFKSIWEDKIKNENQSRLNFYQKLNNKFSPAKYIDVPCFKLRRTIAKLRCSNHCLEIEKGRHQNIAREDRICKVCKDKKVEDEEHFLIKCKQYAQQKRKYQIIEQDAVDIMNNTDQNNLAKYLVSAFNLRRDILDDINKK